MEWLSKKISFFCSKLVYILASLVWLMILLGFGQIMYGGWGVYMLS